MFFDAATETLDRAVLQKRQLRRVQELLAQILPSNQFYARKLGPRCYLDSWERFRQLPFTTKSELAEDQERTPPWGTNLTYPMERYSRFHQTSGTTGRAPVRWLDTDESWDWWARCWGHVFTGAGVGSNDRIFYAFSFGPFIGFWAAYEGARKVGAMTIPGGGMETQMRLKAMRDIDATVLCCTPTYALRMAEVADEMGLDRIVSNQPQYNMIWRVIESEVVPLCEREGIGQIVWSPIAQGALTGKYLPGGALPAGSRATDSRGSFFITEYMTDDILRRVQNLRPVAEEAGLTLSQLAVAWTLQNPGVAAAIVGATKPEQIRENVKAAGVRLDEALLAKIDEILGSAVVRDPALTASPRSRD